MTFKSHLFKQFVGKIFKGKIVKNSVGLYGLTIKYGYNKKNGYNKIRYKQVKDTAKNPDISNGSILLSGNTNYDATLEKVVAEYFPRGKNTR